MKIIAPKQLMENQAPVMRNGGVFSRASLDLQFARTRTLDSRITFSRASSGTYVDAAGVIRTAGNNVARFDHNPTTGESLGLLVEESRINYVTQSESFSTWTVQQLTQSTASDVVAPDGTTGSVQLFTENETNNTHRLFIAPSAGGAANHAHTIFVKVASGARRLYLSSDNSSGTRRTLIFDLANETYDNTSDGIEDWSNITIEAHPNGWYRVGAVIEDNGGSTLQIWGTALADSGNVTFEGDGTSGFYLWGAQLETDSFPTSYIRTTGSTATRSADVASITGTNFSSWYNQTEGTVFSDSNIIATGQTQLVWRLTGGTYSTSLRQPHSTGTQFRAVIGDTFSASPGTGGTIPGVTKAAVSFSGTAGRFQVGTSGVDVTASGAPDPNTLNIGTYTTSTQLNGTIRRFTYWPTRLSNDTLQQITS